jgi:hypothetical protein
MNTDEVIKKKRGRKPKNSVITEEPVETVLPVSPVSPVSPVETVLPVTLVSSPNTDINNVQVIITDSLPSVNLTNDNLTNDILTNDILTNDNDNDNEDLQDATGLKVPKKRGRKPKGGKIIVNSLLEETNVIHEPNIILHLKCKFSDLENTSLAYDFKGVDAFQFEKSKGSELGYHIIDNHAHNINVHNTVKGEAGLSNGDSEFKILCNKLKNMSYNLQNNNIADKKSDCFWCTCPFDNPPIYIPKYQINNVYQCYGCFCSPECASAFLFKESIDTSTRFERYSLLNHIYNKVYNYTKNVKPAPDPYYTLNKYYGDLTIQEYRRLFKSERLLIVVDKPLSRVLPELHEYNDDIMVQENLQNTGKFKIKRKTKQNKTDILNETFNISS